MNRGLGWRIHDSVEDTKLSTNKQHSLCPCLFRRESPATRHGGTVATPKKRISVFLWDNRRCITLSTAVQWEVGVGVTETGVAGLG